MWQHGGVERNPLTVELEDLSGHLEWLQALAVSMVADRQTAEDLVQHALGEASNRLDWKPGRLDTSFRQPAAAKHPRR